MKIIYSSLLMSFILSGCISSTQPVLDATRLMIEQNNLTKIKNEDDKYHLIHFVKEVDNTHIEFWINPFEDEVIFDYEFTNIQKKESNTAILNNVINKEGKNKSTVIEENLNNKENKDKSNSIESYLNNYENAQAFYYAKSYAKALISVKNAIEFNPEVAQGYKLQGTILYTLGRYDEALDAWKKALKLNPKLEDVKKSIKSLENN